jgi:hypothetical protein
MVLQHCVAAAIEEVVLTPMNNFLSRFSNRGPTLQLVIECFEVISLYKISGTL